MTPDQAKTIMDFLAGCIERESAATKRVLEAVPSGQDDFKPHEKCMPAMKLAWHIAASENMFLAGIPAGTFGNGDDNPGLPALSSGAEIATWYAGQTEKNVAALRAMTPEECTVVINFHDVFKMPAYAWAQLALTHAIHHRGQLSSYIRPMGGRVPSIYGPSGDDEVVGASA